MSSKPETTGWIDPILQVERWPDRKRKVLSKVIGNESTILATFASDKAAKSFLDIINDRLIWAYQLGKKHAVLGDPNDQS